MLDKIFLMFLFCTTFKQLFAPEVDFLIHQAKYSSEVKDELTKNLIFSLFEKLQLISVSGDVERRELWLSEYPDPLKWYLLTTMVYRETYSVFIAGKLVLSIQLNNQE